jgi:glycosyltransferase involved in cell wall biosynthesis
MQLIEAAKILKRKDPQVQIVLVGDGMEKPRLLEAVKQFDLDNVTLIDPVPKSQISDYLSASDVCTAVLKKCDTFKTVYPNKVFDYMCAERPIIIGIDGVARKLVEDAKAGLYVEPEDPAAFVNAVETIKTDYENMKNLAVKAREFAVKNFSRISLSEKYLEIIERQKNREDRH